MTNSLVHSFQSETLCLFKAYHVVPKFRAITPLPILLVSCCKINSTVLIGTWQIFSNGNAVSFSLSVIKLSKRCNSASTKLGNTLHTLNRGKLSPESFAASVQFRWGHVFKQYRLHSVPSGLPRFTVRRATTVTGRITKQ